MLFVLVGVPLGLGVLLSRQRRPKALFHGIESALQLILLGRHELSCLYPDTQGLGVRLLRRVAQPFRLFAVGLDFILKQSDLRYKCSSGCYSVSSRSMYTTSFMR